MLEFIVLGLIPGTNLQITFNWVLLAVGMVLATAVLLELLSWTKELARGTYNKQLSLYQLVQYSGHRVVALLINTVVPALYHYAQRVLQAGQKTAPSDS